MSLEMDEGSEWVKLHLSEYKYMNGSFVKTDRTVFIYFLIIS